MELKHSQEMIREDIFLHRGERNMQKKGGGQNSIKTGTEMTINKTKSLNKYLQMARIS